MRRTQVSLIALTLFVSTTFGGAALAKEGFFSRWNPMHLFRSAPARATSRPTTSQQRLQSIRAKMEARGLSQELIDRRAARLAETRPSDDQRVTLADRVRLNRGENGRDPTLQGIDRQLNDQSQRGSTDSRPLETTVHGYDTVRHGSLPVHEPIRIEKGR